MATTQQIKDFISKISPIIQKYAKQKGYKLASPIIAQACLESGWGESLLGKKYHNYFGMKCGSSWKGKSVNLSTKEEYKAGTLTNIKANFRVYDNMEKGVSGYFDFISTTRYAELKKAKMPEEYLKAIKNAGYCTSSTYVNDVMRIIKKYGLEKYDNFNTEKKYTVTAIELNCRCGPSVDHGIKGIFKKGTKVTLIEKTTTSWYKVKGVSKEGKTITGYCSKKYLS